MNAAPARATCPCGVILEPPLVSFVPAFFMTVNNQTVVLAWVPVCSECLVKFPGGVEVKP